MKNSFLFNLIKKFIAKRSIEKNKYINRNRKVITLFLNSNPWFSAVTDYSLQLCLYLKKNNEEILYGAEKGSTAMDIKCKEYNIPFFKIPIHNVNIFNFIISFCKIVRLLSSEKIRVKYVIAFEGREHTLLILTKVLFPFLWHDKKLIRVRGQSQEVKKKFSSVMVYKYYTDKIIFAATCVLKRIQFEIPKNKFIVQPYCKDVNFIENRKSELKFTDKLPLLHFQNLTFLILGRFDPVKGHDMLIQAYFKSNLTQKSQLVLIGKSENIKAKEFYEKYSNFCTICIEDNNKYYLEKENKCVYIIDEKFNNIYAMMQNVHFGIISSLDSEVICRVGVEFLQNGVPCLYSDAGALSEVFSDFPELNFKKGDEIALRLKMEEAETIFHEHKKYDDLKIKAKKIGYEKYNLDNLKSVFKL